MALQLTRESDAGVPGNYWRVISLDRNKSRTLATIGQYLSKEASDSGRTPLSAQTVTIAPVSTWADAYEELKKLDPFTEAADC